MAWIAKAGDQALLHTLRFGNIGRSPCIALCDIELDPAGDADPAGMADCSKCSTIRDKANPPRARRGGAPAKLPRCTCAKCGSVHIVGRDT